MKCMKRRTKLGALIFARTTLNGLENAANFSFDASITKRGQSFCYFIASAILRTAF